jgi:prolyl-tRNA synthetase
MADDHEREEADPQQPLPTQIPKKSQDFNRWYTAVIRKAGLAEYSRVRGSIVLPPYGYALWELVRDHLDAMIKETGHSNVYFPLLMPESYLRKEAEHVEGFAPQVAWVTHAGSQELEERLAIRPTSETVICMTVKDWVHSHRDLPLLLNQWCNVVRWELRTRFFLRTTEFLWQEGHTFHATAGEAQAEVSKMLEVYRRQAEGNLAIPVIPGKKSEAEKFAGAEYTLSLEGMMSDGKALQMGTSHYLGQNFARAFDIQFSDQQNQRQHAYSTSWGTSWRVLGAIVLTHGDDAGLILPPRVAPVQAVVVPIYQSDTEKSRVREAADRLVAAAGGVRVHVDWREERPGFKFNAWEVRGVPLRIELGPRDLEKQQAVVARRDTRAKSPVALGELAARLPGLLEEVQQGLFDRALQFQRDNTVTLATLDEMAAHFKRGNGFVRAPWCGDRACEARVTELTTATLRCIPLETERGPCAVCGREGSGVLWAKAY